MAQRLPDGSRRLLHPPGRRPQSHADVTATIEVEVRFFHVVTRARNIPWREGLIVINGSIAELRNEHGRTVDELVANNEFHERLRNGQDLGFQRHLAHAAAIANAPVPVTRRAPSSSSVVLASTQVTPPIAAAPPQPIQVVSPQPIQVVSPQPTNQAAPPPTIQGAPPPTIQAAPPPSEVTAPIAAVPTTGRSIQRTVSATLDTPPVPRGRMMWIDKWQTYLPVVGGYRYRPHAAAAAIASSSSSCSPEVSGKQAVPAVVSAAVAAVDATTAAEPQFLDFTGHIKYYHKLRSTAYVIPDHRFNEEAKQSYESVRAKYPDLHCHMDAYKSPPNFWSTNPLNGGLDGKRVAGISRYGNQVQAWWLITEDER